MTDAIASRVLVIAQREVGVRENGGPNKGMPFTRYSLPGEQPLAWCARFVRYCVEGAGGKLPGNRYEQASVAYVLKQFQDKGWMVESPEPGDIVFFRSRVGSDPGPGNHIGFVVSLDDKMVQTIEGNSGDAVKRREYMRWSKHIIGYGRYHLEKS